LASRHHSLDLSELADVTELLVGFEKHNNVRLSLRVSAVTRGKSPALVIVAEAWPTVDEQAVHGPLALVNVNCSDLNLKHWNAVLTHVLYALDFQLALNEYGSVEQKRA